jgi:hypothetical protein
VSSAHSANCSSTRTATSTTATEALRVLVDFLDKRKIGRPWIEQLS